VSDGRVIRWDGPELGWTTFATTSNKRYWEPTQLLVTN
jgi:hypothetical protein